MSVLGTCGPTGCWGISVVHKPGRCSHGFPKFLAELKRTPNMLRLGNSGEGEKEGQQGIN